MEESPITTILVPVDGSKNAYKALEYAEKLGLGTNATIDVLHVVDTHCEAEIDLSPFEGAVYRGTDVQALPLLPSFLHARAIVDEACRYAAEKGMGAQGIIAFGEVPAMIVSVATSGAYSIIVMGTRGQSNFPTTHMGHVSELVAETAPCPVLLAR